MNANDNARNGHGRTRGVDTPRDAGGGTRRQDLDDAAALFGLASGGDLRQNVEARDAITRGAVPLRDRLELCHDV
jgi:hypothetical protein